MKLMIPELGTRLKLSKAWSFNLMTEKRNESMGVWLGAAKSQIVRQAEPYFRERQLIWLDSPPKKDKYGFTYTPVIGVPAQLSKGTVLEVDRIYIRQGLGNEACSSVTFKIRLDNKVIRFWAKLADVNTIQYTLATDADEAAKERAAPRFIAAYPYTYKGGDGKLHTEVIRLKGRSFRTKHEAELHLARCAREVISWGDKAGQPRYTPEVIATWFVKEV